MKRLFYKYHARRLVVDGNGMGIGFIDYLVKPQIDAATQEEFPEKLGLYKVIYKEIRSKNLEPWNGNQSGSLGVKALTRATHR